MRLKTVVRWLGVCVVLWGSTAWAQVTSVDELNPEQEAKLVEHLLAGNASFNAGRYAEALGHYDAAMAVAWLPEIFYRRGLCLERLDRIEDAILSYRRFLELEPNAPERGRIEADVARLEAKLEATRKGSLVVTTDPAGAEVTVRDAADRATPLGPTPIDVGLPAGEYSVTIALRGHETQKSRVSVRGGAQARVHLELKPAAATATRLKIDSNPPIAEVRYDGPNGRVLGPTPLDVALRPGRGTLFISAPGYKGRTVRYELQEGETLRMSLDLEPVGGRPVGGSGEASGDGLSAAGLGLTIAGGVLLLGSGGMWALAEGKVQEANDYDRRDPSNTRAELNDLESEAKTLQTLTWITGGVGAAALLGGALLLVFDDGGAQPAEAGAVRLSPTLGGAALEVTFE